MAGGVFAGSVRSGGFGGRRGGMINFLSLPHGSFFSHLSVGVCPQCFSFVPLRGTLAWRVGGGAFFASGRSSCVLPLPLSSRSWLLVWVFMRISLVLFVSSACPLYSHTGVLSSWFGQMSFFSHLSLMWCVTLWVQGSLVPPPFSMLDMCMNEYRR